MLTASQLKGLRALVIDDLREMRSMLRNTLLEAQIKDVVVAPDARAAVEAIRAAPFNLILSDYDLGIGTDGQQLLEYLRREKLMPPGGLFFVISGDATIDRVASAAEMLPDGYLIKPVQTEQLLARIEEAIARHVELRPMYEAVHAGRWAEALVQCERLEKGGSRHRVELLRHAGMCQVALARWDDAMVTYRRALQVRSSMTWARIGLARCELAMGELEAARTRLQQILVERPYHAGAYDLMLELLERTGDVPGALAVAARAAERIPSAVRHRRLAESAYLADDLETADEALTKLMRQTAQALTRESRNGALLAQVALARGEPQRAMKLIEREVEAQPTDARTKALAAAIEVQAYTALSDHARARESARVLADSLGVKADPRTRLLMAKAALVAGMRDEALAVLEDAVKSAERMSSAESASARALAAKVLTDAGLSEQAADYAVDRSEEAAQEAEVAVRRLRAGAFDEALSIIQKALPKAREHTGVLMAAAEIYLMTMRVRGVQPAVLEQVRPALARLKSRGTADPERLRMMENYLAKLEAAASDEAPSAA
ncbi:MAG: response regulator [Burkholderiales bacterium]